VAETEIPFTGDNWFWADDNAKALELLTLPALWPGCAEPARDEFPLPRLALPRALHLPPHQPPADAPPAKHGGWGGPRPRLPVDRSRFSRGAVTVGMRFHDGRDTRSLRIAGHRLRFRAGGAVQEVDLAGCLQGGEAREEEGGLTVLLHGEVTWRSWGRPRRLGQLTLTHRFPRLLRRLRAGGAARDRCAKRRSRTSSSPWLGRSQPWL
jgi:hypothetical protein